MIEKVYMFPIREIIVILAAFFACLVLWLLKKYKLSKLKVEEKDIYYNAVKKIKKIDLSNKMFWIIGIILFIIIAIVKVNIFPTEYMHPAFGLSKISPSKEVIQVAGQYMGAYYIVRILFNKFYVSKRIDSREELSENEKMLLKKYYITSVGQYVCSAIIFGIGWIFYLISVPIG